jgi:hypothetical protein
MCNNIVIVITQYDGRRPGLSNEPVDMEYNNKRTLESAATLRLFTYHARTQVICPPVPPPKDEMTCGQILLELN